MSHAFESLLVYHTRPVWLYRVLIYPAVMLCLGKPWSVAPAQLGNSPMEGKEERKGNIKEGKGWKGKGGRIREREEDGLFLLHPVRALSCHDFSLPHHFLKKIPNWQLSLCNWGLSFVT